MPNHLKKFLSRSALVLDYVYDNIYRVTTGLPRLNRSKITDHLYLGSQYNLTGLRKLKEMGITAIVNMRTHNTYGDAAHEGIKYLHLPTVDNTPPPLKVLIRGAEFIDHEIATGGTVYVHCRQGLGRGPTMAMAYLEKTGLTFETAFKMIKKIRVFINPTKGQVQRLKQLETWYKKHAEVSEK